QIYDVAKLIFTDSMKSYKQDPAIPMLTSSFRSHLKVAYMPPLREIGPDPLFVQFEFSVSDQQGGVVAGFNFNITVMPVDDEAPELRKDWLKTLLPNLPPIQGNVVDHNILLLSYGTYSP
ncbi:unnamed protein product, partial [Natator depressus]